MEKETCKICKKEKELDKLRQCKKCKIENSIKFWKKKLWEKLREHIIDRDKSTCFTCNAYGLLGGNRQGGHFITGATCPPSLYFDTRNVHIQCYRCNVSLSGNWVEYERKMIIMYGKKTVDELKDIQKKRQGERWTVEDYKNEIKKYENM